jgi:predicted DNA-binding transcriptional regulator YafY
MVQKWGDKDLGRSAKSIIQKLESVLPESESQKLESTALFAFSFRISEDVRRHLRTCRRGINDRRKLNLEYLDPKGNQTFRMVRPLGLFFWGQSWTLGAYCELREGFRNFRLDRMTKVRLTRTAFELESPVTLADYIQAMKDQ